MPAKHARRGLRAKRNRRLKQKHQTRAWNREVFGIRHKDDTDNITRQMIGYSKEEKG